MEIIVSLQVKVCLPEDRVTPIESLVSSLKSQKIEAIVLEEIITTADTRIVTTFCGEKYSKRSESTKYTRAGTSEKTIICSVGSLTLKTTKVRDIQQNTVIKPIYRLIQFSGKQKYQPEIVMISVDFVQKMSYRDTVEELSLVLPEVPSPMTINNHVKMIGREIPISHPDASLPVAMADGTKSHSQEPGVKQNEINVVLGFNAKQPVLLGVTVNQSWKQLSGSLESERALSEAAVIVSDGEAELRAAFTNESFKFQTDVIHGFRILGYKLWEDNALELNQRKGVINEFKALLLSLKNVVMIHTSDTDRIGRKINLVVDGIEALACRLTDMGCRQSAKFLNEYSNTLVTFARLALNGIEIPWNSNTIERLMGEISKRIKHKWMRWTTEGLETLLRLILVRYTEPQRYRSFRETKMGQTDSLNIAFHLSIESTAV